MSEQQTSFRLAAEHADSLRQFTLQLSARAGYRVSQGSALNVACRYALDHLDDVAGRFTAEAASEQ